MESQWWMRAASRRAGSVEIVYMPKAVSFIGGGSQARAVGSSRFCGRGRGVVSGGCDARIMTGTTAADYLWFGEDFDDLAEAYCVTLVRGLSPRTLLARLGAEDEVRVTGVQALIEPAYDACDTHDGDRLFVGVTAVGDWALMVEPNGWLGVTDEAVAPISRGTTVVPHFRNINAVDHFNWFEDGELRLHFEPLFPTVATAATPTASSTPCGRWASTSAREAAATTRCTRRPRSRRPSGSRGCC